MKNNKRFILIILTAIFSVIALIIDQTVFQMEKIIISKESEVDKYKNQILETQQNNIYFENAFKNLSLEIEFNLKSIIHDNPSYENELLNSENFNQEIKNIELVLLKNLFEKFKVYADLKGNFFNYLLISSEERIEKLKLDYNKNLSNFENNIVQQIFALRTYISKISDIHSLDTISSDEYWINDYSNINGYRALRQILIVFAFMLNVSALLCLLNYFKIIVTDRINRKT